MYRHQCSAASARCSFLFLHCQGHFLSSSQCPFSLSGFARGTWMRGSQQNTGSWSWKAGKPMYFCWFLPAFHPASHLSSLPRTLPFPSGRQLACRHWSRILWTTLLRHASWLSLAFFILTPSTKTKRSRMGHHAQGRSTLQARRNDGRRCYFRQSTGSIFSCSASGQGLKPRRFGK